MTPEEKLASKRATKKAYYEANKEKLDAYTKQWRADNIDRVRQNRRRSAAAWAKANPEKIKAKAVRRDCGMCASDRPMPPTQG